MAYTTIDKPTDYFNTVLYTGNGTDNTSITGVGFQPDWVWLKARNQADYHYSMDSVRGALKPLFQNDSSAEANFSDSLKSFDSDGFTLGTSGDLNASSQTMVAWNWLAGGTASSNTDGSITSTVSANTTSGFSIVSYTGTGSNATVGHGLGVAPSFVIIKDRGNAVSWVVSGDNIGWNKNVYLDSTQAVQTANHFQDTAPTSSLMYLATDAAVNGSSRNYIMYCFAEKTGYSKFGSYTGNGSTDGTFVYTGFKPAFVIAKDSSAVNNWRLFDNKRPEFNLTDKILFPSLSDAETVNVSGGGAIDILSNGFKIKSSANGLNASGATYIYMAFGQSIVGSNNIPATAR